MAAGSGSTTSRRSPRISLLSASPEEHDQISLRSILNGARWRLFVAWTPEETRRTLLDRKVPLLIWAATLSQPGWRELAEEIHRSPDSPKMILAAQPVSETLWAEALDLGFYDVLARPFTPEEVLRVVDLGWNSWKSEHENRAAARSALQARSKPRTMTGEAR